ncbi:hypothetical protein ACFC1B_07225 [Streptomyces xiamenensis]|uniref:hypothetical protein n=1 Tax=Streptomyces xiamenensis TaxID=408015 RepID=UPI0035DCE2C5
MTNRNDLLRTMMDIAFNSEAETHKRLSESKPLSPESMYEALRAQAYAEPWRQAANMARTRRLDLVGGVIASRKAAERDLLRGISGDVSDPITAESVRLQESGLRRFLRDTENYVLSGG